MPRLDEILLGGFPGNRSYLIQGTAGSGKTTLGLDFLLEGSRQGETGFYINLAESRSELLGAATSHGWSLDGITLLDMETRSQNIRREEQYTVFPSDEGKLGEATERIFEEWERVKAIRAVIDHLQGILSGKCQSRPAAAHRTPRSAAEWRGRHGVGDRR